LVQLATHTSGLDREPEDTDTYLKGAVADWEKVLLAALPHTKFAFEPGTRFSYSNVGYAILGAALARAAGQTYVDYVRQHVFEPLGMSDTAFEPNDRIRARIAKGYVTTTARSTPRRRRASMRGAATRCQTAPSTPRSATWPASGLRSDPLTLPAERSPLPRER
jgi:CubicO group peptidase (beta-lactamase class C family)